MAKLICSCMRGLVLFFLFALLAVSTVAAQVPDEYLPDYFEGYETGFPIGFESGFDAGFERGTREGTADGDEEGFAAGWDFAYDPAYDEGYQVAIPLGKISGFEVALPKGAQDGYRWAKRVHEFVSSTGLIISTGDLRIRDLGGVLDISSVNFENLGDDGFVYAIDFGNLTWTMESLPNWSEHYYDEGYSDGFLEGESIGEKQGHSEAYPIAFETAFDAAFPRGVEEGTLQGHVDGTAAGYDYGFGIGYGSGESVGFDVGVSIYQLGGELADLDLTAYVASYADRLHADILRNSTAVPEPSSLGLALGSLLLISPLPKAKRSNG